MTAGAEPFVLASEAAGVLRVSERTVRRLCAKNKIEATKVGRGWRIYASALAAITTPPATESDAA